METLKLYFLYFITYSVIGWIWEVIICSYNQKKFVNRGFLNGPYCPIYGFGALIVVIALSDIDNVIILFFASMLFTGILEYFVSWGLEKLFHARWWDYTDKPFNINGRVYLTGAIAFGTLSVIAIKFVHPMLVNFYDMIPDYIDDYIAEIILILFVIDIVFTVTKMWGFEERLRSLSKQINASLSLSEGTLKELETKIEDSELLKRFTMPIHNLKERLNSQERRMLKAFPNLKLMSSESIIKQIRKHLEDIDKDDIFF